MLGEGKIFTVENPGNLTGIDFEYFFGEKFYEQKNFWTPYNDVKEEGVFRNEYNGEVVELDWYEKQPNGGREENFVSLIVRKKGYMDTSGDWEDTSLACSVPKEIITLRGGCKNSLLGI